MYISQKKAIDNQTRQSDKKTKNRIVDENTGDNSQTNVLVPHISKITNPVNRLKRSQKQRKTKLLNCFIEPIEMVNLDNNNNLKNNENMALWVIYDKQETKTTREEISNKFEEQINNIENLELENAKMLLLEEFNVKIDKKYTDDENHILVSPQKWVSC